MAIPLHPIPSRQAGSAAAASQRAKRGEASEDGQAPSRALGRKLRGLEAPNALPRDGSHRWNTQKGERDTGLTKARLEAATERLPPFPLPMLTPMS